MHPRDAWIDRLGRRIKRWCRPRGLGKVWVVAVSGGGDSVALLRVLHQLAKQTDLKLSVAHLDHGVRGESARADAAFVVELAGSLGLPCDLGQWKPARAAHFESDARRARYAWLQELAQARGASVVAVAHTSDDQAETIIHRIVRGTGLRGLAGMPRRRLLCSDPKVSLVRPLLDVSRSELRDYLVALGQPFHEDQSNADLARTRARIRHDLLPKLVAEYNPRVAEALVRLGALAEAMQRSLESNLDELERASVITRSPDCVVLKQGFLGSLPVFLRTEVLRRVWRRAGWPEQGMSARRWRRLAVLVRSKSIKKVMIGAGVAASTESFFLVLRRSPSGA
ncbi:MAG: tRNA lysidine(34) synthetase TilS [Isosphaerales bacterium]